MHARAVSSEPAKLPSICTAQQMGFCRVQHEVIALERDISRLLRFVATRTLILGQGCSNLRTLQRIQRLHVSENGGLQIAACYLCRTSGAVVKYRRALP